MITARWRRDIYSSLYYYLTLLAPMIFSGSFLLLMFSQGKLTNSCSSMILYLMESIHCACIETTLCKDIRPYQPVFHGVHCQLYVHLIIPAILYQTVRLPILTILCEPQMVIIGQVQYWILFQLMGPSIVTYLDGAFQILTEIVVHSSLRIVLYLFSVTAKLEMHHQFPPTQTSLVS